MPSDFVHLHVHTEYSLLDGQSTIDGLMERAKELEQEAMAITDHGVMFGAIDFFRAAKANNIKPVIGMEAYLAPRTMFDRDNELDRKPYHMLLLAQNMEGYRNLCTLASEAQLNGYYYRPRIDANLLREHSAGLIATTGCLASQIPSLILQQREDEAEEKLKWFHETFGPERFFLEMQNHDIEELDAFNKWLILYRKRNPGALRLVATNDVHYVRKEDADNHDTLLCIQTGAQKKEDARKRMTLSPFGSYYLKSSAEMWDDFSGRASKYGGLEEEFIRESFESTLQIADMTDLNLNSKGYHLPKFPLPEGWTETAYMRHLCDMGLSWRFPGNQDDPKLQERLEYELKIIDRMGFNTYFLIVWDLCEFARSADIWWNVRGSGAGSLVAYCLGITSINPLQNSLLFERFLNPGRITMPDIDLDYPDNQRGQMIAYAVEKYGDDKVAAIITFGTMGAKASVKDVGRALGVDIAKINRAAGMIPQEAKQKPLREYIDANSDLLQLYKTDDEMRGVLDTAMALQGMTRHASMHAAGVIISDAPLVDYLPLHRITGNTDASQGVLKSVTQYSMETAESIGLLKVDFLGLSTLTILRKACELIERHRQMAYTMENIPYRHDNPHVTDEERKLLDETFLMLGRGETVGVFQLESGGMQQMLRGMRPFKFEHIIAGISLYRPGPMDFIPAFNRRMHGEEEVTYLHPKLEPILKETYSIMVYQEQLMQIASDLFGYNLGEADLMRRAVSKKKEKDLLQHKAIFRERGPANGVDEETAEKIFAEIEFFANYGFNKCVLGETEIIDADTGCVVTIGELASGQVSVFNTLSVNLETMQLEAHAITDVMANGVKPVYTLTTRTGRQITATANHPFYTIDGWKMLGELGTDDLIAAPTQTFAEMQTMWAQHAVPLRTLIGTSDVGAQYIAPTIAHTDDMFWDQIVSIVPAGEAETYDLTIEGTHNFIANDLLVHNSHAADYAVLTMQTAFLKTHYPEEYMTALLCVQFDNSDKVATFLDECRRLQIPILQPDVNYSQFDFDIQVLADGKRAIRFGLGAIKHVGGGVVEVIINSRNEHGPFASLEHFCQVIELKDIGKRPMESLIKVGAFDEFGYPRDALLESLDRIMGFSAQFHKEKNTRARSLFGDDAALRLDIPPAKVTIKNREQFAWERELMGLYVSGNPLDQHRDKFANMNLMPIQELKDKGTDGQPVRVGGEVMSVRKMPTKSGDMMAVFIIADWHPSGGSIEVVLFPRTYKKAVDQLAGWDTHRELVEGEIFAVGGTLDTKRGSPQIIADGIILSSDVVKAREVAYNFRPPENEFVSSGFDDETPIYDEESGEVISRDRISPSTPYSNGNGNGNGHHNGNGNGHAPAITADVFSDLFETADSKPVRHIRVYFPRKGNLEADTFLLKKLHSEFIAKFGEDTFSIVVPDEEGRDTILEFPHTTCYNRDLLNALAVWVGEDNIVVR